MNEDFWTNIFRFREIGFEPLSWITKFSKEIDFNTLNSLSKIKETNLKISLNWFDYNFKNDGKNPELTRRIHDLTDIKKQSETGIKKALVLMQLNENVIENDLQKMKLFNEFLKNFESKIVVKKMTAIKSSFKKQFAILDFINMRRGNKIGYIINNNFLTQVTDVTQSPDAKIHSNIAIACALENINLLGCTSEFRLFPIYDAPNEDIVESIRKNFDILSINGNNIIVEDYSSVKLDTYMIGSTATATTFNELPTRYDQIEENMKVIITDKMGGIIPVNLFLLTKINDKNIEFFEKNNISFEFLKDKNNDIFEKISQPNFTLGKIISKYCPKFGEPFDNNSHITAVFPVNVDGIFAIRRLSEYINREIILEKIPIKYKDISKFAIREFLVENSTAAMNGCHIIIATQQVSELIIPELRKINLETEIMGSIGKHGKPLLTIKDGNIKEYVLPKSGLFKKPKKLNVKK
ncbi:MAG: hypothetical protein ACPKPY_04795 [Nitrososphaeraceae archaeon]